MAHKKNNIRITCIDVLIEFLMKLNETPSLRSRIPVARTHYSIVIEMEIAINLIARAMPIHYVEYLCMAVRVPCVNAPSLRTKLTCILTTHHL